MMGPAKRRQLFMDIVRLRRAELKSPVDADIREVRAGLERELGPTLSRSLAAQILGVSHTALNRWIANGDVATVITPQGRRAVPVYALLDLFEELEAEHGASGRELHALAPIMARAAKRAEALRVEDLVRIEPGDRRPVGDLRTPAYHRALAGRLERGMVAQARELLERWSGEERVDSADAERWRQLLSASVADIRAAIGEDSPPAADLRRSSPFAGMLSERERRRILELVG